METKVNLGLVGAFVLALGAALVGAVLWLASGGLWQQSYDLYQAVEEESVAGLNLNAPVKYNGVEIGKVRSIALDPQDPQRVDLLLAIVRGSPIKQDTVAVLKAQGLTGIAYVELSGGARDAPPLQTLPGARYPVIATKSSLSTRLENVLTRVLAKLDSTSDNVSAFLSADNQRAFSRTLADIAQLSHSLAARGPVIDRAIADAGSTLHHTAASSAQLEPALQAVERSAASIERMGNAVSQTSQAAGATVKGIGTDMQRFGAETLPELERLLGELSVLSASLKRLSEQTERAPSGLVFGRSATRAGPGETNESKP
ncbi:MAG: MCE family protein [Rhodoferax sp.]|nr:MCE family protein [Rhodoferax sp.]